MRGSSRNHGIGRLTCAGMALMILGACSPASAVMSNGSSMSSAHLVVISLRLADASFEQALKQITSQCELNVIADGRCDELRRNLSFRGSPEQALSYIAKEYDYEFSTSSSGVRMLRRRLKAAGAKPQIDIAEIRKCAKDVESLFRLCGFTASHGAGYYLRQLYQQLPLAERQELQGGKARSVESLPPELARLALQAVITSLFGATLQTWESLDVLLGGIQAGTIAIEAGAPVPGSPDRESFAVFRAKDEAGNTQSITLFSLGEK
jgi:hypothetical protein